MNKYYHLIIIIFWFLLFPHASFGADERLFLEAVKKGDMSEAMDRITRGCDVDYRDKLGKTALLYAVENRDPEMVKRLLERGASIGLRGLDSVSPMFLAKLKMYGELVWLLEHHDRLRSEFRANLQYGLMLSIFEGNPDTVEAALDAGADANAPDMNGMTPLIYAAELRRTAIAELLLRLGVKADERDQAGRSALMYAAMRNSPAISRLLVESKAALDLADRLGRTALMYACERGNVEIAKLLLESGANPALFDSRGRSALAYSVLRDEPRSTQLLMNFKADATTKNRKGWSAFDFAAAKGSSFCLAIMKSEKKACLICGQALGRNTRPAENCPVCKQSWDMTAPPARAKQKRKTGSNS